MPLRGVAWATHASPAGAVAVGDAGTMLRTSGDGWAPVELATSRDLLAVRVAADGSRTVAVGEAGVVVSLVGAEATIADTEQSPTLRALHLGADGRGQVVGDLGTVLISSDLGGSWIDVSLANTTILRGVDDFHRGGHL